MCEGLTYLSDTIFIMSGTKLYKKIVGILIGTNCVLLIAGLFLFCYKKDFLAYHSYNKEAEIIQELS